MNNRKEENVKAKKNYSFLILAICVLFGFLLLGVILDSNKEPYYGPYQQVGDDFCEDLCSVEGIDYAEIRYKYEENRGEGTITLVLSGDGAERYLVDTSFLETEIAPHLEPDSELMEAFRYRCEGECNHLHIYLPSEFEIIINNELYANCVKCFSEWQCAGERVLLLTDEDVQV